MCIFQSEQVIKLRNVLVSLEKNEWPPNLPDLKQLDYYVWAQCWDTIRNTRQNRPTLPSWKLSCYQRYGMIFHKSSLIRQSHHFERDSDHALMQLVDIFNAV